MANAAIMSPTVAASNWCNVEGKICLIEAA